MENSDSNITKEDIQALRAGDQGTLKRIFLILQPRLYGFLWLRTRSVEMSEDLVQETFLRFWQGRDRLRPTGNLETYIFRIASNLANDALRRDERQRELQTENLTPEVSSRDASDFAEYNQLAQIVDGILSSLPDSPRTAFSLSRYQEFSHKEIAEIMDISVKTVEKHISKALLVLKEELAKSGVGLPS